MIITIPKNFGLTLVHEIIGFSVLFIKPELASNLSISSNSNAKELITKAVLII